MGATLHDLPLAAFLRGSAWAYPLLETLHLVAIALLFGSIVVLDLRLIGVSPDLPAKRLAAHALPWTLGAFALAAATGLLLFVAHAAELIGNRVFLAKLGLIAAAGVNAAWFHTGPGSRMVDWGTERPPATARAAGSASILLWIAVIACGRWIAYA
jgi:hypothetical protein